MGLDITSYEHVALVEENHAVEDADGNVCYEGIEWGGKNHVRTYNEGSFSHTLGSLLVDRCYLTTGERFGFRAGSYSGYNSFREELCEAALGVSPATVWATPQQFVGRPFFEMIHFSDCEGVIGPEVCAKLARDFRAGRGTVRATLVGEQTTGLKKVFGRQPESEIYHWNAEAYDNWQRAYELAAADGMVVFH